MTARGEMVKAAGLTNPNPETAVTASAAADAAPGRRTRQFICTPAQTAGGQAYWSYTPGGLPPHTQVFLRFSGIAVSPASP
jgi:hypothetical protein